MSEKEFKIDPKTRSLADRIKALPGVGVDSDTHTLKDNDTFRTIATEDGRDVDRMISDDDYRSDFLAANRLAQGEIGLDYMKDNKDVSTVSGTFEIGRNRMEVSFERHQRVPNRVLDKESGNFKVEGEKDLWGGSNVKYAVHGASNSRGQMKAVSNFLQDSYKGAFSS